IQAHSRNANPEKGKPSHEPERPSSRLGSALAIFSVPGPPWPRPRWRGLFFVGAAAFCLSDCIVVSRRTRATSMVLIHVLPVCVTALEFPRIAQSDDALKRVDLTQDAVFACVREDTFHVSR